MPLPNFLMIGAMKSGSTTLYSHLDSHPDVFVPRLKEPEFFASPAAWRKGRDWYETLFSAAGGAIAVGEASTAYSKFHEFPGVPARIHSMIPDVRLIYLLRDPVARIQSMYEHMVLTGRERRPVDVAVTQDPCYVTASMYARNIELYLEYFGREQMLILLTDDLRADLHSVLGQLEDFLGIPRVLGATATERTDLRTSGRRPDRQVKSVMRRFPSAQRAFHALPAALRAPLRHVSSRPPDPHRPVMSPSTRAVLTERLASDGVRLRALVGRDLPW